MNDPGKDAPRMVKHFTAGRLLLFAGLILCTSLLAFGQEPSDGVTLEKFVSELRQMTKFSLMSQSPKPEKGPSLLSVATSDPHLAKYRYVRDLTTGIFADLNSLRAANEQFQKDMGAQMRKSQPVIIGSSDNPRKPSKPVDPFEQSRKAQEKIAKPAQDKRAAVEASIEKRLEALESQVNTPLGQQFLLPADSPLVVALRNKNPYAPKPGFSQRFEAISITEGGLLAYVQKPGPPVPETKEPTFATDRTKTVFVRGYTKPVTLGDIIRIPVVPGKMITIQGAPVQEYIIRE